jgi:hypothetical protein
VPTHSGSSETRLTSKRLRNDVQGDRDAKHQPDSLFKVGPGLWGFFSPVLGRIVQQGVQMRPESYLSAHGSVTNGARQMVLVRALLHVPHTA